MLYMLLYTLCKKHQQRDHMSLYLSLGRLIFGCVGQRLLRAKSLRTILMAFPSTTLVLASSRP